MPEVLDIASALKEFAGDPRRAGALAAVLGFQPVPSPVDLLGPSGGATPIRDFFAIRDDFFGIKSLFRVGGYRAGAAPVGLYVAELHEWGQRSSARDRARRRVARAAVELSDDARTLVVLVPQESERTDQPEIEVVLPRVRTDSDSGSAFTTVRALVDARKPSRFHRERIRALALAANLSIAQVSDQWRRAFSVEAVTRKFYSDYADVRDRIAQALASENSGHSVVAELDEKERKDCATRQLGRVLFLWFLQAKRWLGYDRSGEGPATYLADLWNRVQAEGGGYYRRVLRLLFFDAMARPLNRRSLEAKERLGEIPYLNGGLFRTNALEDRIEAGGAVDLPDSLFEPDPECLESVLGLFSRYHFTTRESTPDDQSVDPDPELLGRVFENLYQGDARHDSGTYYTPREIVHFMCRQALHSWLSERIDEDSALIELVRLQAIEPRDVGEGELISPDKARQLQEALDAIRICDPAVGSGAFLLGAMQEIVQLRRGLALADGQTDERIEQGVVEWKRRAIQWSLYGVDNNPEAVEICHLRLWLSLVLDLPSPSKVDPLPNLDFRVVAGDSLIDRIGDIVLPESLPVSDYVPPLEIGGRVVQDRRLIERWKREFEAEQTNPRRLRELRDNIIGAVKRILETYVNAELLRATEAADAPKPSGLLTARQRRQEERERRAARERVQLLERARDDLDAERGFWRPFLWPVLFHEAFQDGGFDLVLANPPYVRQERLSAQEKSIFKVAFPEVFAGTADLHVFFYARALQILRDSGWLAFVTSNKYMRAAYGNGLRGHLSDSLKLSCITDLGDLPVFDSNGEVVAAYPAVLIGGLGAAGDHALEVADLTWAVRRDLACEGRAASPESVREALTDLDALVQGSAEREYPQVLLSRDGWILEDPDLVRLFDHLMSVGEPLGEFVNGRIYRGVTTGLNDAFVIDQATRDALVAADPKSADVIKFWLRGKDIKRWTLKWEGHHLMFPQRGIDIECFPAIRDYLRQFRNPVYDENGKLVRKGLEPRGGRNWRKRGNYKWYEIQDTVAYYNEFARPKSVWKKTSFKPAFAWDESGSFLANTVHFIADDRPWICALLNGSIYEFLMSMGVNLLRGGYIELTPDRISPMPIPHLSARSTEALSDIAANRRENSPEKNTLVNELAFEAFGIDSSDRQRIEAYLARRREFGPAEEEPEAHVDD